MAEVGGENYLDTVPNGALETVVRELIDSPKAQNWARHLPLREI